jgi:hypothetical protein
MKFALCQTAFSQLQSEPSHASELLSQLRFGEPVKILQPDAEWCFITTEHGYRGFVRTAHLFPVKGTVKPVFAGLISSKQAEGLNLPYSAGAFCWEKGIDDKFSISPEPGYQNSENFGHELCQLAKQFSDVPYVWGGKIPFGLDCSGLVQLVFNLAGFSFPRDAWQQAEMGEELAFDKSRPEPEVGDLLFFRRAKNRIHHVAISLGGSEFIHASEWVRIESLSPGHPEFAEDRLNTLCQIKKIRPAGLQTLSDSIRDFFKDQNI